MPQETKDARFWNRTARKYARDRIADPAGYERTLARTAGLIAGAEAVLEAGCGTGSTALRLAPGVGRIVGCDLSSEMVAIAWERTQAKACHNAEFIVASATETPGGKSVYDAALAFNLLHLVPDRAAVLARLFAQLKPGGLFISKTPCLAEMSPLLRAVIPAARALGLAPHVGVFAAGALAEEIAAAGFEIVEQARHGSEVKDARIFIVAQRPVA